MTNEDNRVLALIRRYEALVSEHVADLRNALGQSDLLMAANSRLIPRSGVLPNGVEYFFHGVGCTVETPDYTLDFDFGPIERVGGFDAWRLSRLASQLDDFGELSREEIEEALERLSAAGVVIAPGLPPSPHLRYLAGS